MNNTILIIIAFLFGQTLYGQISLEENRYSDYFKNKNGPILEINVKNLNSKEYSKLKVNYFIVTPLEGSKTQIEKTSRFSENGKTNLNLDYPFPNQQIFVRINQLNYYGCVYLNDGLSIVLDADSLKSNNYSSQLNGICYKGEDALLNETLLAHRNYLRGKTSQIIKQVNLLKCDRHLDMEGFITQYDSLYAILSSIDDKYISKYPTQYATLIKNERLSSYYHDLCVKYWCRQMPKILLEKMKQHKVLLTSNDGAGLQRALYIYLKNESFLLDYSQFFDILDRNQRKDLASLLKYRKKAIIDYPNLTCQAGKERNQDFINYHNYRLNVEKAIGDSMLTKASTQYMIDRLELMFPKAKADFYKLKIANDSEAYNKDIVINTLLASINTEWCKSVLEEENRKHKEYLAKVNAAIKKAEKKELIPQIELKHSGYGQFIAKLPNQATLYKVENIEAKKYLVNLLAMHKDEALLLDFWGTWCHSCIAEFPSSKKLQKDLKDEPITFIFLCTSQGTNIERWKSRIIESELGGIHLFVDEDMVAELMEMFNMSGYPSYAFFNCKGEYKDGAIDRVSLMSKKEMTTLMNK